MSIAPKINLVTGGNRYIFPPLNWKEFQHGHKKAFNFEHDKNLHDQGHQQKIQSNLLDQGI